MANRIKRITALVIALSMCLSLLSANVWATEETTGPDTSITASEEEPVQPTIKLNKTSLTLDVKKTKTLKATVTGPNKKVTWKSSNKKIATVDKNGKVTAKNRGKCTITAEANGIKAKCIVIVKTKKDKALDCYKQFLSDYSNAYSFALAFINKDDIPELIVQKQSSKATAIFSYRNGSVYFSRSADYDEDETTTSWLSHVQTLRYYKKKEMVFYQTSNGELCYDRLRSNGFLEWYYHWEHEEGEKDGDVLGIHGLTVMTKSKFNKMMKKELKKRVGSTKASKPSFHKNTKSNRKKYLK